MKHVYFIKKKKTTEGYLKKELGKAFPKKNNGIIIDIYYTITILF